MAEEIAQKEFGGEFCVFSTLKFQLFPPLEESMSDCWSERSHLAIYSIRYALCSLILTSPPWAVGKGMANLEKINTK